jgi:hypothetical protein
MSSHYRFYALYGRYPFACNLSRVPDRMKACREWR